MKTIRGLNNKLISTCDRFGSVNENNDIFVMIMTKKFHHKCACKTKFKQCLTIHKTNITMQFELQTNYSRVFLCD